MTNETKKLKHEWRNDKANSPADERMSLKQWARGYSDGRRWMGRKK